MKRVILLGAGASMKEGIEKGLWEKIASAEKWSLNHIFRIMPYLPSRQIWVDIDFIRQNLDYMQKLHDQGVPLYSSTFSNHKRFAAIQQLGVIHQYHVTRELDKYPGKKGLEQNLIFCGRMGLCGIFALHLAICEGFDEIFLLGYDFGSPSKTHRFTHVYQDLFTTGEIVDQYSGAGRPEVYILPEGQIRYEVEDFQLFAREQDVKIWNVSTISNIPYFEKISYDTFFGKINATTAS